MKECARSLNEWHKLSSLSIRGILSGLLYEVGECDAMMTTVAYFFIFSNAIRWENGRFVVNEVRGGKTNGTS